MTVTPPFRPDESWLARRAAWTPDADAIRHGDVLLSYAALQDRASALAARLREAGVQRGDVVGASIRDGLDFAVMFHALRTAGAVLLPLNLRLTPAELGFQLRDSGALALVHGPGDEAEAVRQVREELRSVAGPRLGASGCLWGNVSIAVLEGTGRDVGAVASPAPPECTRGSLVTDASIPDALAILYTSGTTGRPKAAVLGPESFLASAESSALLTGAHASDRWLACLPLFHVGGLSILVRACIAGGSVRIHDGFDPVAANAALDREGITMVSFVASMLQRVIDVRDERPAPSSLRCVLLGGGPTPPALIQRARELGFPVAPTYGLTEVASQVATRLPEDAEPPFEGRLRPLPGHALRIVDEAGRACTAGGVGEICVRGPAVMRGYLGRPEATAAALRDGWLHTGDIGSLDFEGRLRVFDRRDDLIVSGGENVYPAEIEAVLAMHPGVAEAGVVGAADERLGARPVAYWVAADGESEPRLREFCRARLAGYKIPVDFRRVDALPRGASGKLLRRELRRLA